jgi:predicted AlkP superfamily phosphohydrolase/phosphomutase
MLHQILGLLTGAPHIKSGEPSADDALLDWMPAARYSAFWPRMSAFALPSFYDGRVRINLRGREGKGRIPPARYEAVREEIVEILEECRDPITGNGIIDTIWRSDKDPSALGADEADLYVIWRSASAGIVHPRFGTIGPLPYRRTGGHTGEAGFLLLCGSDINPGERPPASSFDVVPMIIDLL